MSIQENFQASTPKKESGKINEGRTKPPKPGDIQTPKPKTGRTKPPKKSK